MTMEDSNWQKTLVQWINSLGVTPSITSIDDLKDGEFFICMCKMLILELFHKLYPNFDFNTPEMNEITTLLSCQLSIHDGNEKFVEDTFNSLPEETKVSIKNLLISNGSSDANVTESECVENLQDQLHQKESEISELKLEMNNLKKQHKSQIENLEIEYKQLVWDLEQKNVEISKLTSEAADSRNSHKTLWNQFGNLDEAYNQLGLQLQQKEEEISKFTSELEDSSKINKTFKSVIDHLELDLTELNNKCETLQKENRNAEKQIDDFKALETTWKEKYSDMERSLDQLVDATPPVENTARPVVDLQLSDMKRKNENLKNILKDRQDEIKRLTNEFKEAGRNRLFMEICCNILIICYSVYLSS